MTETRTLVIVGVCLLLILIVWYFARRAKRARSIAAVEHAALVPIVGRTRVTPGDLLAWHRAHAESVGEWIEHHQGRLELYADKSMAIDLTAVLAQNDEALELAIEAAIAQHPESQMRAHLSRLAVAGRNTLDSLRRSDWTRAEEEHVVYVRYRDAWLDHLQAFTRTVTHEKAASAQGTAASRDDDA